MSLTPLVYTHSVPPTDSIVSCGREYGGTARPRPNDELTKEDAAGPSRTASPPSVNGSFGMILVRKGMSSEITIGKPIAAGNIMHHWSANGLGEDTNKEVKHTDCLCYSHCSTETNNLDRYEKQDPATPNFLKRLVRWHCGPVADKIIDLRRDPVTI